MQRKQLYTCLFFFLPLLFYFSENISLVDLGIWIAQGRHALEHHQILRHDVFSVFSTGDLIYPVGVCLFYGILDHFGGLLLVSFFHKLCVLTYLGLVYYFCLKPLRNPWSNRNLLIVGFSLLGSFCLFADRPAEVAIVPFFVAYLILDDKTPLSTFQRVSLCALTTLWVNIHGSWILLPLMFAWRTGMRVFFKKEKYSALDSLTGIGIFLASLLNPFTWKVYPLLFQTVRISRRLGVDEWAVTWLKPYFPQGLLFFILFAVGIIYLNKRKKLTEILDSPFFPLVILGFSAIRNTVWPFFALIPFTLRSGLLLPHTDFHDKPKRLNTLIATGVFLITLARIPLTQKNAAFSSTAPWGAMEAIQKSSRPGPVFNSMQYGSTLAYAQKNPYFLDIRYTIYSESEYREYFTANEGKTSWDSILNHYSVRFALLDAKKSKLASVLRLKIQDWRVLWEDSDTVLFEKQK